MANYGLTNNLSALPLHSTSQYDSELIVVDNNAGRPITARASYITNLNDISVTLAAGNLDVGSFHIEDPDSGLKVNVLGAGTGKGGIVSLIADTTTGLLANVASVGTGQGALRVLTQDLDSVHDSITVGDQNGNFAYVTSSALNVFTTNGISAVSVTNFPTQLTAVSITNFPTQLTAVSVTNQLTSTSVTLLNPTTAVGVFSLSTYVGVITATQVTTNTLLNSLTANVATSVNQVTTNSLLNSLTANGATSVNQNTTNTLLNSVTANQITLNKQLTGITILNPVTTVNIKQTVTNWDVLSAAINSSTYTTLPSNLADEITILNNTGGIMYIKNASKTIGLPIDNNTSADFKLVGNTNEVAVLASSNNKTVFATFISYN
jgi:hypothetical protein